MLTKRSANCNEENRKVKMLILDPSSVLLKFFFFLLLDTNIN